MTTFATKSADLTERAAQVVAPVLSFRHDFDVVSGDGSWITTSNGRRLLDFGTGIACLNLGHNPPTVVEAVHQQVDRLFHAGWGTYLHEPLVRAAEKVVDITPERIEQVIFLNSGAEAVEAAVKLARKATGRQGVVAFRGGFHGRTMGSVTYGTSKASYREGYHPLVPSVFITPFPHPFRWGLSQQEADAAALDDLERMFRHEVTPGEVAAFLIEPIQGEGGYYPASPEFLAALRAIADEHGILLLADEVQSGFGRSGSWFAVQELGVEPDMVIMGKAIANGLPFSGLGASKEVFSAWKPGAHGTTYGGNPIGCAAAAATIDALAEVVPTVSDSSAWAFDRLADMAARHDVVGDVRGLGLMIGVDLVDADGQPDAAAFAAISKRALDDGLFLLPCGTDGNVIRFIPPLNVSKADLDRGLDILDSAIAAH